MIRFFRETYKGSLLIFILLNLLLASCSPAKFSTESKKSTPTPSPSPSPTPDPGPAPLSLRDVHYSTSVNASNNMVDIVLVIDDSNSMLADNQKLAAKLSNFVTSLQNSNLDWQACVTITNAIQVGNNNLIWGASLYWQPTSTYSSSLGIVLKKGQANLPTIFSNTINYIGAGWAGTDDERAVKAAYHHVYNGDYHYANSSGCYRKDAGIAYIIISDEDERSIGGDKSQQYYTNEYQPLEDEDQPATFINYVKSTFGNDKRFTVNSIIVKPGDTACKATQDSGAKSHFGTKYAELSNLTGGGIGSICDSDYSTNLNLFVDKIIGSLSSVPLECTPVGDVALTITPTIIGLTTTIQNSSLVFNKQIPIGSTVDIKYKCNDSRAPSSIGGSKPQVLEQGLFASIINFFKNLF